MQLTKQPLQIMKFSHVLLIGTMAMLLGAVHQTSAATVLASYPFTGSAASTDSDPNSTASNMFFNTNTLGGTPAISSDVVQLTYSVTTNRDTTSPATGPLGENIALSEAASVSDGSYVSFTITPDAGYSLFLEELTFDIRIAATGSSNGIRFFVRSDAGSDGFTTTLGSGFNLGTSFTTVTVDLSGPVFQDVDSPISFRLYYYDRGSTSSNALARWELDNVNLTGAVIPEPSTALMILLGLGLLFRRTRGHKV
jgi:hypothetical protein